MKDEAPMRAGQTRIDKDSTIAALAAQWQAIDRLVSPLSDEQWNADAGLPGWTVADVVAHIVGTENMLDGRNIDPIRDVAALDHVKNPIGVLNENWLDHYRALSRDVVMADLRAVTAKRLIDLRAMTDDEWNSETATPVGPDSYGRFMRVRDFDCWVHEIDIRDALGLGEPSEPQPAALACAEFAAVLPFVIGKKARVPAGTAVTLEFTGLVSATTHVAVAERAAEVPDLDGPADVTLRVAPADYARIAGGRPRASASSVEIVGDAALGEQIVDNLHYLI